MCYYSIHKVHKVIECFILSISIFAQISLSSFCCSVLHILSLSSIFSIITVLQPPLFVSSFVLCSCMCEWPSTALSDPASKICRGPTSKSLHSLCSISKTTLLVSIMEPPIMTITLYQYQYTSHFSQGLKPPFLKLGRVTLPFYYNLHGTNVI